MRIPEITTETLQDKVSSLQFHDKLHFLEESPKTAPHPQTNLDASVINVSSLLAISLQN